MRGSGGVRGRGVCMVGGMHGRGGHVWQGGCMVGEGMCGKGGMCGRKNGNCSGRYASYWNAFLLLSCTRKRKSNSSIRAYFNHGKKVRERKHQRTSKKDQE